MLFYIPTKAPKCINHARHKTLWTEGESLKNPCDIIFQFWHVHQWLDKKHWMADGFSDIIVLSWKLSKYGNFLAAVVGKSWHMFHNFLPTHSQSDLHRPYFYLQMYISELFKMKRCIFILPRLKFKWGYGAPPLTQHVGDFQPRSCPENFTLEICFFFSLGLCYAMWPNNIFNISKLYFRIISK